MRLLWLLMVALVVAGGCTRQVSGVAQPDPRYPPVQVSEDGYGVVAGFADAPVHVEIFTEPQCTHCADLQADFGDEIAGYLNTGQLKVTYRPLTFLDAEGGDHSARVSNAMFAAADSTTSATAFQELVQQLWAHQEASAMGDDELASMARDAGVPADVADRIAAGDKVIDTFDMTDVNLGYLFEVNPLNPGTPTVYAPIRDEVLDIYDDNWLAKLMSS
ncbi:thioredoxin domain-containing protein [Mycobacterium hubeiense]|uniref:thioredoxin domain-containing protein n=1 Tax=Mycobacterium hubeiense TaxID=1867256 RepID=UPI000C7EA460|nr:thioredoxin domain-containing protein [Mycobacterium sp. QGD 101]